MEQTMMISRETQELLRENNALRQRVRTLEARLARAESEKANYARVARMHFRQRLEGYDRRREHADLREDIFTAGKIAACMVVLCFVAWNFYTLIWGL